MLTCAQVSSTAWGGNAEAAAPEMSDTLIKMNIFIRFANSGEDSFAILQFVRRKGKHT